MERSPAVVWTCLLGAGLALALPPALSVTTSKADPRPPRLIGCVFRNRLNVTCRWEAGDAPTALYTLQVHLVFNVCSEPQSNISADYRAASFSRLLPNSSTKAFTCTTSDTSCTVELHGTTVRNCFCTIITAHSRNGSVSSHPRCQSVMLPKVTLTSVKSVGGRPQCLNVTWSHLLSVFPVADSEIKAGILKSQIEFRTQGQSSAQVETVTVKGNSFLVCLFRPDTSYAVRLRHRFQGPESPWSVWSSARQGRTGEDAPSAAPAFWRQLTQTGNNGWRLISLLWKPLPRLLVNGRVLFFNVTCQTESAQVLNDYMSCADLPHTSTSCSLLLPAGRCSCNLTASTSAGPSPEARIWFSAASEIEPPPLSQITVRPLGDSVLDVHWTAPINWSTSGFVVEWFAVREKNSSILRWEKLNSSCRALVITEGVRPMERYAVSVKALYGGQGAGQNRTVHIYTRQGVPSAGPTVVVQQISSSRVELTWNPVAVELLHGFISNYTIYYTTANQTARRVMLPGDALRYTLEDLLPGNYDIFMQANTVAGAGAAGPIANVHIGSEEISIVMYAVLPLFLTPLALVLMACLAQNKRVKQKLCPAVPDPSNSSLAHWTPKVTLEGPKRSVMAERTKIKYSDVVLLGESEPCNSDPDQDLSYQHNLRTSRLQTSYCYSPLPVSGAQTPQTISKRLPGAKTTSNDVLSSIYSNVILSQPLQSLPTPLQFNSWQPSAVSSNAIKVPLGGDSKLCMSLQLRHSTTSDSPLSQTDDTFTTSFSPHFVLVDFSYHPVECEPYISPAV